jgi:hypothetical protein
VIFPNEHLVIILGTDYWPTGHAPRLTFPTVTLDCKTRARVSHPLIVSLTLCQDGPNSLLDGVGTTSCWVLVSYHYKLSHQLPPRVYCHSQIGVPSVSMFTLPLASAAVHGGELSDRECYWSALLMVTPRQPRLTSQPSIFICS